MTSWTDEYREVVTYYFWEPNHLRPRAGWPAGAGPKAEQMWRHVSRLEVATNHMLNLYFTLVPFAELNRVGAWVAEDNYELLSSTSLRAASDGFRTFTQPDLYLRGDRMDLALELKTSTRTSVDQVSKYIGFQGLYAPGRPWTLLYVTPSSTVGAVVKDASSLEAALAATTCPAVKTPRLAEALSASWDDARAAATIKAITFDDLAAVIEELRKNEVSPVAQRVHAGLLTWLRDRWCDARAS